MKQITQPINTFSHSFFLKPINFIFSFFSSRCSSELERAFRFSRILFFGGFLLCNLHKLRHFIGTYMYINISIQIKCHKSNVTDMEIHVNKIYSYTRNRQRRWYCQLSHLSVYLRHNFHHTVENNQNKFCFCFCQELFINDVQLYVGKNALKLCKSHFICQKR